MDRIKRVSSVLLALLMVAVMVPAFIVPETPVEAAEAGVIENGGFETVYTYTRSDNETRTGATGWTISDWYTTIQTGTKKSGSYAARISAHGDAKGSTVAEQIVPANTNATYTLSFQAQSSGKSDGCSTTYKPCFTYTVYGGTESGNCTNVLVSTTTPALTSSGWKNITANVQTGNYRYVRITFTGLGNNDGGDCYLDDVALTVVNAGDTGTHAKPSLKGFGTELNRPASSSDNVIVQPGFESTTNAQWNTSNFVGKQGVSIETDASIAHSGSKYLKYYHPGNVAFTEWPMFEVVCPTAGEYVFSVWVRTPLLSANNTGAASIGIINPDTGKFLTYGNAGGSYDGHYSNTTTQLRSTATDDNWHLRSVTFYVGANNSTIKIGMYGLKSTMYVDDISVHLLSKGVKYTGNQTGALSASTSVSNQFCEAENSLIPDGSFNGDPSEEFWTKAASGWNNGFLEFNKDATTPARKTSLHFKGTSPASNKTYRYIKFVNVEPNTAYTVSFDYRVVKTGNPLMFIDNNIVKNVTFHTPNLGSASNTWKTYAFTFNTGNYNRIGIVFKDGSGEAYFDDFRFFKNSNGIADEPKEEVFPTLKHNKINGENEDVLTSTTEDGTGLQGYGLAFQFKLACTGAKWNAGDWTPGDGQADWSADFSNAYVDAFENGGSYKLVKVGAVMTNQESVGTDEKAFKRENANNSYVIDVEGKYLWNDPETTPGYITHVMRIINIPPAHLSTLIYARPYYVFEYEGQQITMYGDIVYECYEDYPDINDGWLEWD